MWVVAEKLIPITRQQEDPMRPRPIARQIPLALAILFALATVLASAQTTSHVVGSITAISGRTLTLQPDKGAPASVPVSENARILRMQPGAKKLSDATPITLTDLTVGDRVLAAIKDGTATTVVVMKQTDIAQKQQAEAADWQTRGAGGPVKAVDPAAGTVTIRSGARTVTIHTTPQTIIRRYSADSALFSNAAPSKLDQIKPGDQLRVRGDRSADGSEIQAEEIIAGTFRDIAGIVLATNPTGNTVTVSDRLTKKSIVIHVTAESQLHKLPPAMAAQLAMRLKERRANGQHSPAAHTAASSSNSHPPTENLSRMLERAPTATLSDLHKGDAVIIVATQGTPESATALTLLAGVEPLLRAFPSGDQSVFSASWNLNGGGAGGGSAGGGEGTQ
jgi:Cu/Ag efflux protein CusF